METSELAKIIYEKSYQHSQENTIEILNLLTEHMPANLFRYRSGKYYNDKNNDLDSLRNNNIWLSDPQTFNDPFDSKCGIDIPEMIQKNFNNQLSSIEVRKRIEKELEKLNKATSIACFTESNKNRLMWSHYANNHQGYCLEYSSLDLQNAVMEYNPEVINLITIIAPVYYSKSPDIWRNVNNPKPAIFAFLKKDHIWAYEKEWRILISNAPILYLDSLIHRPSPRSQVILRNLKPTKIIMGCKIEKNIKLMNELISISKEQNIPLYIADTKDLEYSLEIIEYNE